jgi:hypothetical protein
VTPAAGGPIWGAASADLNATLLEWPEGHGPAEHVNEQRDVLYVVLTGSVTLAAGPDGVRYLTAHIRRGGLEIKRL